MQLACILLIANSQSVCVGPSLDALVQALLLGTEAALHLLLIVIEKRGLEASLGSCVGHALHPRSTLLNWARAKCDLALHRLLGNSEGGFMHRILRWPLGLCLRLCRGGLVEAFVQRVRGTSGAAALALVADVLIVGVLRVWLREESVPVLTKLFPLIGPDIPSNELDLLKAALPGLAFRHSLLLLGRLFVHPLVDGNERDFVGNISVQGTLLLLILVPEAAGGENGEANAMSALVSS